MPCLRGNYCPYEGMINALPCPEGHICDIHKLSSPRAECPPGFYCNIGIQGNDPFYQGLIENNTFHCDLGTYCRGGMSSNEVKTP